MSSLRINFEAVRQGPFLEVFEALEASFQRLGIDFYIIGAFARDMWLMDNEHLPDRRITLDLDLAIYIAEWERFYVLKKFLESDFGFIPDKEPYRMFSPNGLILDLIPFGGVEKDHQVYLEGNPPVQLSVFGTTEVTGQAVSVDSAFHVITIPGLCIMKLVSWSQRPEWRRKDLSDFWYLLENYSDIDPEIIFTDSFLDLLTLDETNWSLKFAQIMGRQMNDILKSSPDLEALIFQALEKLRGDYPRQVVEDMYPANEDDQIVKRWMLAWSVIDGMKGG